MSEPTQPDSLEFRFQAGERVGGGRFRLERPIGRGGMGTVWQAFDERLNESVALKFLAERIRGNPTALNSMRRETSRSHSLSHQNIVRIHDLHEVAGEPAFISMEYVVGQNLHELARSQPGRAFPLEEVWRWTRQLCAALIYAHSRGVIHRDLKPANVMLDSARELKLADFGLASALRDPAAQEDRTISGTPAYMSPQQFAGAPAAVTDDIYSLGACVFELLAGGPVFEGPDLRRKIELEPAPLLSSVMAKRGLQVAFPDSFEDLVLQCLSKNPQSRPQSAQAFLDAAAEGVCENDSAAEIEQPKARLWLFARWRKLAVGAVAATVAAAALMNLFSDPARGPFLDLRTAPVRSSSDEPGSGSRGAFDGMHRNYDVQTSNRWASSAVLGDASEWVTVDLGADMRIRAIVIDWELAHAKDYSVRTRTSGEGWTNDPAQWTQRGSVSGFREKSRGLVNLGTNQQDVVFDFVNRKARVGDWMNADRIDIDDRPFAARHVMVNATARGTNNPGIYSIHEVEINARPAR